MEAQKLVILIVDDSLITNVRMGEMLEELENVRRVLHAGSFEEGIALVSNGNPDIVLLDIHLPDISGIELLRVIRHHRPAIKVVMISNQAHEHYRDLCKSLGADYFFDKAREFDKIPLVISRLC